MDSTSDANSLYSDESIPHQQGKKGGRHINLYDAVAGMLLPDPRPNLALLLIVCQVVLPCKSLFEVKDKIVSSGPRPRACIRPKMRGWLQTRSCSDART